MTKLINPRLDSDLSAFFARELEQIKAETFDVLFANLKAMELLPVSTDAGPGAESITYQQFEKFGDAKIVSDYARDFPSADIAGREFTTPVKSVGASFQYSIQEMRAAQLVGRGLTQRKADSARRAIEQRLNKIAWFGDDDYGLRGFLTHPDVPRVASPQNGEDSAPNDSTLWTHKTPDQILEDMNTIVRQVVEETRGIHSPDTMLLPIKQYQQIHQTRLADGTDTTIAQFFLMNNPNITEIHWLNEAKDAGIGVGGVGSGGDLMVAYQRDPSMLTFEMPQMFEMFPPQEVGMCYKVYAHSRTGGVLYYYPLSARVMEGI